MPLRTLRLTKPAIRFRSVVVQKPHQEWCSVQQLSHDYCVFREKFFKTRYLEHDIEKFMEDVADNNHIQSYPRSQRFQI